MKALLAYALLASVVSGLPQFEERDDNCEIEWVTLSGDAPTGSSSSIGAISTGTMGSGDTDANSPAQADGGSTAGSAAGSSTVSSSISNSTPAATSGNSTDTASALNLPNLPDGTPAIPLTGDHLKAPTATDPVPPGAATYTPKEAGVFDCSDFQNWSKNLIASNPSTKWMVIKPGSYRYALGQEMAPGTDPNTVNGENLIVGMNTDNWTLDMRGTTMYIDVTPENKQQRPTEAIYTNQVNDVTILGGTIWIDQGELWTQARITEITDADSSGNQDITVVVDQGYNVSAWRTAGPRNQDCIDDSNPDSFSRPDCNFWYMSNFNFDNLDSKRTWTAQVGSRSGIQKGYVLNMQLGVNSLVAVESENNNGLHVKGLTTNGALGSIGNQNQPDKKIVTFEDVYMVNPPSRPGFAPRVNGPALSWGNIGGMVYDAPGQPISNVPGSFWQTTAAPKDLQAASNTTFA